MPHYADVSFGKDSMAMLFMLADKGYPLDAVRFFDTGMEFGAIYRERDRLIPKIESFGIEYIEFHPSKPFWWSMMCRPVKSRKTGEVHKHGYGWCGGACRWGTTEKQRALDKHQRDNHATVYLGIAADETTRIAKNSEPNIILPLVEWGMTEADCLEYCYSKGATWDEGGVRLYDVLDRVSCWCCRNKNMKELRAIHDNLPLYWELLVAMEDRLGQMKSKPLSEIGGA